MCPGPAQQPNLPPDGKEQFDVERYTSQSLAVYIKDAPQRRMTRFILGPGNDPRALINQGR